jgi:hypothetical protein
MTMMMVVVVVTMTTTMRTIIRMKGCDIEGKKVKEKVFRYNPDVALEVP